MAFQWLSVKLATLIKHGPARDLFLFFFIDSYFILSIALFFLPLFLTLTVVFCYGSKQHKESQENWENYQEGDQERSEPITSKENA